MAYAAGEEVELPYDGTVDLAVLAAVIKALS
jgi:hypothetical protein